jgi:hypothetical protein
VKNKITVHDPANIARSPKTQRHDTPATVINPVTMGATCRVSYQRDTHRTVGGVGAHGRSSEWAKSEERQSLSAILRVPQVTKQSATTNISVKYRSRKRWKDVPTVGQRSSRKESTQKPKYEQGSGIGCQRIPHLNQGVNNEWEQENRTSAINLGQLQQRRSARGMVVVPRGLPDPTGEGQTYNP